MNNVDTGKYLEENDGWALEDRPIRPGVIRPLWVKGNHTDSCIKTENGWICNPICSVEENDGDVLKIEVDKPVKVETKLDKIRILKWEWQAIRCSIRRTFNDGRSFREKDEEYVYEVYLKGQSMTKFGAKKSMVEAIENNIPNY